LFAESKREYSHTILKASSAIFEKFSIKRQYPDTKAVLLTLFLVIFISSPLGRKKSPVGKTKISLEYFLSTLEMKTRYQIQE